MPTSWKVSYLYVFEDFLRFPRLLAVSAHVRNLYLNKLTK
jgi:hypothetical protein